MVDVRWCNHTEFKPFWIVLGLGHWRLAPTQNPHGNCHHQSSKNWQVRLVDKLAGAKAGCGRGSPWHGFQVSVPPTIFIVTGSWHSQDRAVVCKALTETRFSLGSWERDQKQRRNVAETWCLFELLTSWDFKYFWHRGIYYCIFYGWMPTRCTWWGRYTSDVLAANEPMNQINRLASAYHVGFAFGWVNVEMHIIAQVSTGQ